MTRTLCAMYGENLTSYLESKLSALIIQRGMDR